MYEIAINGYGNLAKKEIELFSIEIAPAHLPSKCIRVWKSHWHMRIGPLLLDEISFAGWTLFCSTRNTKLINYNYINNLT